ncbi:hypothetical protein [Fusobacterium necrophorum]|uniref:hypothetical protein n=1 Tax=Fusobacterium necrophorum TaxID=859 RepID=UPI00241D6A22
MEARILQEFCGVINGITIYDRYIYYSVQYLLEKIEEKFGFVYNEEFILYLSENIETISMKYDSFDFAEMENDFSECIQKANSFNEIQFKYCGLDWKLEDFNKNIKDGKFFTIRR